MRILPWALAAGLAALLLGSLTASAAPLGGPLQFSLWYYAATHVDPAFWSGDPAIWRAIDIVNPRVLVGTETMQAMVRLDEIVALCKRYGKTLHGHGAVNARTLVEAEREAVAAAAACKRYGLTGWHANAEDTWAGTSGKPRTAMPAAAMGHYGATFKRECAKLGIVVPLAWTSYSWPNTSDGRPLATASALTNFDVWAPMVYSNGADGGATTLRELWRERVYRLDMEGRQLRLAPLLATGRKDAAGFFWGDWATLRSLVGTEARPVSEIGLYYGAGSLGMLTDGNARTRPLPEEIADVRTAYADRWGDV